MDRVSQALTLVSRQFIRFPTGQEASRVKRSFYDIAGFPNVLGAVDGTLIRIQSPKEHEDDYFCRKGYHALNVQVLLQTGLDRLMTSAYLKTVVFAEILKMEHTMVSYWATADINAGHFL